MSQTHAPRTNTKTISARMVKPHHRIASVFAIDGDYLPIADVTRRGDVVTITHLDGDTERFDANDKITVEYTLVQDR